MSSESFAYQLEEVITAELNKVAPLKTVIRKAGGKPVNRFLSRVAKDSIHDRRLLERRWKRSLDENDRTAYRRQCRETNRLTTLRGTNWRYDIQC